MDAQICIESVLLKIGGHRAKACYHSDLFEYISNSFN